MTRQYLLAFICLLGMITNIPSSACANQTACAKAACAKAACANRHVDTKNKSRLPNIVLILADDMGYGDAKCYNKNSKIPTTHLDQLAQKGMRFTDAHTPSSVCSPTRYGLLTGRYAWRTEMKRGVLREWDRPLIKKNRLTVPSLLNQHGYHTACIGKWHLGWNWKTANGKPLPATFRIGDGGKHPSRLKQAKTIDYSQPLGGGPLGAGFAYYFGDDVVNQPPYLWIENNRCITQPTEPLLKSIKRGSMNGPATPNWNQADVLPRITKQAVKYLHDRSQQNKRNPKKEKPFFLYFPLTAPHVPLLPNKPYQGKSTYGAYGDFVHQVDDIVGQMMKALDQTGFAKNTLFIFASDNGSFASVKAGHSPNGDLRGKKSQIFEGGHRVPFLVRWPGKIKAGSVNRQLVGLNDLMATLAAIVGHPLPNDAAEDSTNLLPTLLDSTKTVRQELIHHSVSGEFAIRDGDWKLITDRKQTPVKLFNIANDLAEKNDVYAKHPKIVNRLAAKLKQQCQSNRSVKFEKPKNP